MKHNKITSKAWIS